MISRSFPYTNGGANVPTPNSCRYMQVHYLCEIVVITGVNRSDTLFFSLETANFSLFFFFFLSKLQRAHTYFLSHTDTHCISLTHTHTMSHHGD